MLFVPDTQLALSGTAFNETGQSGQGDETDDLLSLLQTTLWEYDGSSSIAVGQVTGILDGNTLTLRTDRTEHPALEALDGCVEVLASVTLFDDDGAAAQDFAPTGSAVSPRRRGARRGSLQPLWPRASPSS